MPNSTKSPGTPFRADLADGVAQAQKLGVREIGQMSSLHLTRDRRQPEPVQPRDQRAEA